MKKTKRKTQKDRMNGTERMTKERERPKERKRKERKKVKELTLFDRMTDSQKEIKSEEC